LIVFLTVQGFAPARASVSLPGLEGFTGATLISYVSPGLLSLEGSLTVQSMAEFAARLSAASPLRAMGSFIFRAVEPTPASADEPESPPAPSSGQPGAASAPASEVATGGEPAPGSVLPPVGCFNYTVGPGDDFGSMAKRFGTTPEAIAEASGLSISQVLYDGMSLRIPTPDPAKVESRPVAVAVPWSEVNDMWAVGAVAQVTDVGTGRMFYVMRGGGWAHADVEPVSSEDTAIMSDNYGGEWSWSRRSIVVVINGRRIAASQNGMPHAGSTLDNNFPGHFCIHFLGSTTHGSSYTASGVPTLDPAHQRCVQEAIGH
jgi:LysM repeat protein